MYPSDHDENILNVPNADLAPVPAPGSDQDAPAEAGAAEAVAFAVEAEAAEAAGSAPADEAVPPADEPEAPKAGTYVYVPSAQAQVSVKKPKKKRAWLRVAALILACALVGGASGVGGALLVRRLSPEPAPATRNGTTVYEGAGTPVTVSLSKAGSGKELSAAEVYASNVNSVVGIVTQVTTNVWGQRVSSPAAGSGFVLTQDGYIVTNYHVVEDASSITVQFKNGDEFEAKVVGAEAENDVAVLKINATGLTPVRLGTSADLVVGEQVVAIGNPLGEMTFSMTHGMVSALDKALTMTDGSVINVLQTDAAINSGNSGGPLFNMYGQVIGITNAKYSNNGSSQASIEGICFAIPIDDVKDILTDLIEHGYVTGKPYVGVTLSTANAAEAAKYGRSGGAYVQSVVAGSAADKAGLRKGDIITAVDGQEIDGHAAFMEIKNDHKAGDTVSLTVDREARTITLSLTFDEQKPDDPLGQVPAQDIQGEDGSGWDDYDEYFDNGEGYGWDDPSFGTNPFDWFGW